MGAARGAYGRIAGGGFGARCTIVEFHDARRDANRAEFKVYRCHHGRLKRTAQKRLTSSANWTKRFAETIGTALPQELASAAWDGLQWALHYCDNELTSRTNQPIRRYRPPYARDCSRPGGANTDRSRLNRAVQLFCAEWRSNRAFLGTGGNRRIKKPRERFHAPGVCSWSDCRLNVSWSFLPSTIE